MESEEAEMENAPQEYDWSLLEDAVEYEFTGWRPEEGDMILGTVAYVSEGNNEYNPDRPYPMVAIVTREGEAVMVHGFHEVLRNGLERQDPQTGDKIAIKRLEDKDNPNGREPMKIYNVIVDKRGVLTNAAALPTPNPKALPEGEPEGWDMSTEDTEAEKPEHPLGWDEPVEKMVTKGQMDTIDKLRQRNGMDPIDWTQRQATYAQAADYIDALQADAR